MTQMLVGNSQYSGFSASRTHFHSNGLSIMPTAGVFPQPAQVVALHGGLDFEVVVGVASRAGEPPQMLSPKTTNPNRIFLQGGRWGEFPMVELNGIETYTIGVWFLFGFLSPEGLNSAFYLGSLPFPGLDQNEYIPGQYFNYQLINQGPTQTLVPVPNTPTLLSGIIKSG
jgi:hypothetical protein